MREDTRGSQLTDNVGHLLQFVLRATHDDHIQPSSGQLEMKQPSNHVCNCIFLSVFDLKKKNLLCILWI